MLDALTIPPRMVLRALDDLHTLAVELPKLREAAEAIPPTEHELSRRVDDLNEHADRMLAWFGPIHEQMIDVDDTAENLEAGLNRLQAEVDPIRADLREAIETVRAFHAEVQDLRDKIPGI